MRGFVVLGLRQQIGGDPVGISRLVGDDQDFGRPRDHVDADLAEHDTLGGGDISVAGTDDLGHRLDALRAIGERGDRLRAADAVDFIDARKLRRGEHQRIEIPSGAGTTMTTRGTPATFAGTAFISTDDG